MNPHPTIPPDAPDPEVEPGLTSGTGSDGAAAETGETGGPKGPEPTRYGDWEKNGRCIDF